MIPVAASAQTPLPGLTPDQLTLFEQGLVTFNEHDTPATGLGPFFNGDGCVTCHSSPVTGGSSPVTNPLVPLATAHGATNIIPFFEAPNGPALVARDRRTGLVTPLYSVAGRDDATNCALAQPALASDPSLRNPPATFGLGLVERTTDATLVTDQLLAPSAPGVIKGRFNRVGTGQVGRFGLKAQLQSLLAFAGEAYVTEVGVSNELFPMKRDVEWVCQTNPSPEDATTSTTASDIVALAAFTRGLAPLPPLLPSDASAAGATVFGAIGCASCHVQSHTTMTGVTYSPFSDFALHDMGAKLADGVVQGLATGSEWRTAPLWGLHARLFMLHDGRATDIPTAILAHSSPGSEANAVVDTYEALSATDRANLLAFLGSL